MFLHAIKFKPLNGRDGRFSTGRSTAKPYRDRAVEVEGKWLTEQARHPFDGCRGTVATVTGGSPSARRLGTGSVTGTCLVLGQHARWPRRA
jgi:hypothetical protein